MGVFAYFCEGHDDNSKNSQTNMRRYQGECHYAKK